jgi:2'-hydroxyisoflavone reductase
MRVLILGGTLFLGRHIADALLNRGHQLVLFNRGLTAPELFPDVERVTGDRTRDLDKLAGMRFDAVIDTCGYLPSAVRAAVAALREAAWNYCFIRSISVYDAIQEHLDEVSSATLALPENVSPDTYDAQYYGAFKMLCERAVTETLGAGRALIIRPGLIVGPHDPTDRFSYWPHRIARGGDVLAPSAPDFGVQFIDVRDLAAWIVAMLEKKATGTYNATSPPGAMTLGSVLDCCRNVSGSDAHFVWVDEAFLTEHDVKAWTELPLWISRSANIPGILNADVTRASLAGLRARPIEETVDATLAWLATRSSNHEWRAGLEPERERSLLTAWRT